MAKITRILQRLFGSSAGLNRIAQFGSLKAATPNFTTDPAEIQSLVNFLQGWDGAILGQGSPALQDLNGVCLVFARQIAYGLQAGVAEYNDETAYYIGSLVNDGEGNTFVSRIDDNTGNPPLADDGTKWRPTAGFWDQAPAIDLHVPSGKTYFQPFPIIPVGHTWEVEAGGLLVALETMTVNGTLITNGTSRVV